MAEGLGAMDYREACRKAGINSMQEELEEADMVPTFRIMHCHVIDKLDKNIF